MFRAVSLTVLFASSLIAQVRPSPAAVPKPSEDLRRAALKATHAAFDIEPRCEDACYAAEKAAAQAELRTVIVLSSTPEDVAIVKEVFELIQAKELGRTVNLAKGDKSLADSTRLFADLRKKLGDKTLEFGF